MAGKCPKPTSVLSVLGPGKALESLLRIIATWAILVNPYHKTAALSPPVVGRLAIAPSTTRLVLI